MGATIAFRKDARHSYEASRKNKATYRPPHSPLPVPSSDQSRAGRTPFRRVALWLIVAAALIAGLVLFFLYGGGISPVLGGGE
jgi:hypothetical protein